MTETVSLLFGVHAHQPVGNFPQVIDEAHLRCYQPFIRLLYRYPTFRFAVHFSGWLLDYLVQTFPKDIAILREMVRRGQVEVFGGGDTEPILAAIPYRDRVGQIVTLSNKLERQLGARPSGAWLTERVWETTVVPALSDAGIRYVTVDDYHFLCTGKTAAELTGYYTTEEDGRRLNLFPILEALRYRIPFANAMDSVRYIESLAQPGQHTAAVYFDDIEKFGIWPETYEWVYEKGWLMQFVEAVLGSTVIKTQHFADYSERARTKGIIYLPTTSYIEMNEWTLPAKAAAVYHDLSEKEKQAGRWDTTKPHIRGGIWRNFLSRYPEANWMHKRTLKLSERLHALPAELASPRMRALLYQTQANDAYWHGLFGGLYLPHLRRAVYNSLVELEALLDRAAPRPPAVREDIDADGHEEVFLNNGSVQAVVVLDGSASIQEFDSYRLRHNFADVLARRPEAYRAKLQAGESRSAQGEGIASAHDRVAFKQTILPADLVLDEHNKTLFRDTLFPAHVGYEDYVPYYAVSNSGSRTLIFSAPTYASTLYKEITLDRDSVRTSYSFDRDLTGFLQIEIPIAMPSCDGPAGRYWVNGDCPGGFGAQLTHPALTEITFEDDVLGGCLVLHTNHPVAFSTRPFMTVSQSEAGFEKIMQAVVVNLVFALPRRADTLIISLEAIVKE